MCDNHFEGILFKVLINQIVVTCESGESSQARVTWEMMELKLAIRYTKPNQVTVNGPPSSLFGRNTMK